MPTSATGSNYRRHRVNASGSGIRIPGFTLIELLIVIAIIGLATATVALAVGDPRGRLLDEGERFAVRSKAARDMAIIEARETAVLVDVDGYRFEARRRGAWQRITTGPLARRKWSDGTAITTGEQGRTRIVFDPTGATSAPLGLRLQRGDETIAIAIETDGTVRVTG